MPLSGFAPAQYEALLEKKVHRVSELLAPFSPPPPDVFASNSTGFRQRVEFRLWHDGDDLNYVMFRRNEPKTPITITEFPIADIRIQRLMPILRERLRGNATLRWKLFQIEFLASLAGDLLVTLVYHRKLDDIWEKAAHALREELSYPASPISLIGRSRKQKIVLDRDFVQEVLPVRGREYRYRQYEQSFSQPNGRINIHMIEWACAQADQLCGDLLELYCGNGNFTVPLSLHFDNLIATEVSKASIRAARTNLAENNIDNVQLIRLSAEEVTQAMNREREFRRLRELPRPLHQYQLETLFVDPPRGGLDDNTVAMTGGFTNIIYISCNPITLVRNLQLLDKSHQIVSFALFDQFPYTDHMECGVVLQRR
jgi:tRNA (uracil-5-)-methyltransferase